jgi:hypothetical protein
MHKDAKEKRDPVITMTHPAEKVLIVTNPDRVQKVEGEGASAR